MACVLFAFVSLGALNIRTRNSADVRPDVTAITDGREVIVTGYVVHDGELRGAGAQRREMLDVQIEDVQIEDVQIEAVQMEGVQVESVAVPNAARASCALNGAARELNNNRRLGKFGRDRQATRKGCLQGELDLVSGILRASGLPVCGDEVQKQKIQNEKIQNQKIQNQKVGVILSAAASSRRSEGSRRWGPSIMRQP